MGIEQDAAHPLADLRAAGFARGQHFQILVPQNVGEALQMRALAAAVQPFKGNKAPVFCSVPHRGMITKRAHAASITAFRIYLHSKNLPLVHSESSPFAQSEPAQSR